MNTTNLYEDAMDAAAAGPSHVNPVDEEPEVEQGPSTSDVAQDLGHNRPSQADRLVELGMEADLFHTSDGEPFATIQVDGHKETWPLRSKGFRRWLAHRFYVDEMKAPASQPIQNALAVLDGQAVYDGPELPVYTRIAEHGNRFYYALADKAWRAVEVGPEGWRVITEPPVRFRRARGMLPLPEPIRGGTVDDLRQFTNVFDEQWPLLLALIVQATRARGPYPVLNLYGEQGSAKTTVARVFRRLIDPNVADVRAEPRDARDLIIAATNGWIVALDNLSHLPPWLSDALCRLSTGGGFSTRELYSDADEVIFDAQRPVVLTGISELPTRGDLADRSVMLHLRSIREDRRRPEREFWAEFDALRPGILGALMDAVSMALRRLPEVHLDRLPRMADFTMWATAAEPALGIEAGSFYKSYVGNREAANELALESSIVALTMREFMGTGNYSWSGTSTDLLKEFDRLVSEDVRRGKSWPRTARALSGGLRRVAPNLRAVGIDIAFDDREPGTGRRLILVERTGIPPSPPSQPSGPSGDLHGSRDGSCDGSTAHVTAGSDGCDGSDGPAGAFSHDDNPAHASKGLPGQLVDLELSSTEEPLTPSPDDLLAVAKGMGWPAVLAGPERRQVGPGEFAWTEHGEKATPDERVAAYEALEDLERTWR